LLSETHYCELDLFRVVLVAEDDIHYFTDRSCLVLSPVNVVYRNGTTGSPCCDPILIHKTLVHEKASGFTVKESHEGYQLLGVHGDNLDLEV
jgi:hypothetical protein